MYPPPPLQGLMDDFIRSTTPSPSADGDSSLDAGTDGVSLEDLFQPVRSHRAHCLVGAAKLSPWHCAEVFRITLVLHLL